MYAKPIDWIRCGNIYFKTQDNNVKISTLKGNMLLLKCYNMQIWVVGLVVMIFLDKSTLPKGETGWVYD